MGKIKVEGVEIEIAGDEISKEEFEFLQDTLVACIVRAFISRRLKITLLPNNTQIITTTTAHTCDAIASTINCHTYLLSSLIKGS